MRSIGLDVGRTKAAVAIHEGCGPTRNAGTRFGACSRSRAWVS
jgi:hypothetical protein